MIRTLARETVDGRGSIRVGFRRRRSDRPARPAVERLEGRELLALALDSTFGTGGSTAFSFSANDESAAAGVAIQSNGGIVEVGTDQPGSPVFRNSASVIAVSRLTSAGVVDTSFGTNGVATIELGNSIDSGSGVAVQSNGDIVVVGTASQGRVGALTDSGIAVARLLPNGQPDTSFGDGTGQVLVVFPGATATGDAILVQPDGKLVVTGTVTTGTTEDFGAARLNADGSLDTTFGTGGLSAVQLSFGAPTGDTETDSAQASSAALQSDGKIVIGGLATATYTSGAESSGEGGSEALGVVQLDANGTPDATFGDGGIVKVNAFNYAFLENDNFLIFGGVALQSDGKIIVSGIDVEFNGSFLSDLGILTRLNTDGSVDTTFQAATSSEFNGPVAVAADDSIDVLVNSGGTGVIVQYNADGSVNAAGHSANLPFSGVALAIEPDGKVVVAGTQTPTATAANPTPLSLAAVARINGQQVPGDYFGTGVTDLAVDNPSTGTFSIETPTGSKAETVSFGPPSTLFQPVWGDFDGDGKADLAVYSSQLGIFAYRPSGGGGDVIKMIGGSGAIPVSGYSSSLLLYYPQYAVYTNLPTQSNGQTAVQFGIPGASLPVVGNFTGGTQTELGYYVPQYSVFSYMLADGSSSKVIPFGPPDSGFLPAIGDYDGDGTADLALYSSRYSLFLYQRSSGGSPVAAQFGPPNEGFVAVPGDYDGDGKSDLAIYNAQYGIFIYRPSSGGADRVVQFGPSGGQATAVLTAGVGSNLITPAIHVESVASASLASPVVMGSLDLIQQTVATATTPTTTRKATNPPTPLP